MDIINFLRSTYELPEVKKFIEKAGELKKEPNEKYKSWIGFNYQMNQLESIKLYFAFYKEFSKEFLSELFSKEQIKLFFRDYDKKNLQAITSTYEFGSGFAIGLKIDVDLNVTKAFGYNLLLDSNDESFLKLHGININQVLKQKGVYHHFSKGETYEKKYYYLNDDEIISKKLKVVDINEKLTVPILEVGFGKGFYRNSSYLDEKYILLGNYEEVFSSFMNGKVAFNNLKEDFNILNKYIGVEGFCPGIYQNKKVQSLYIGYKENETLFYNTVEKIGDKLLF